LLHDHAIQPIQQYDLTKGKNASDIALVIDVMDVLYTREVDVICLVSSDCDFTPLVTRALADGKIVLGFGERKTPEPFVNACSKFLFLDSSQSEKSTRQIDSAKLKSDTKLINLLRQAIDANEDENGWAHLSPVGSHISNQTSFDCKNYGFKNLSSLIKAIDLFELKRGEDQAYRVRSKRKPKPN
jgi:uncharacterized LabA/DUF88 family protein